MNLNVQQKALDCLEVCGMAFGRPRADAMHALMQAYSSKAIERKLYELAERGYIEFGGSPFGGWLTEKGRATLRAHRPLQETA